MLWQVELVVGNVANAEQSVAETEALVASQDGEAKRIGADEGIRRFAFHGPVVCGLFRGLVEVEKGSAHAIEALDRAVVASKRPL